jgi:hypothetical protein
MPEFNPVQIEEAIRKCANRIADGVKVCSERYGEFLEADRFYDRAFARAYLKAMGAAHERKYEAELATVDERDARDVADQAYKHADRQSKALDAELRAWQSVGASVRQMYGVAGRGES